MLTPIPQGVEQYGKIHWNVFLCAESENDCMASRYLSNLARALLGQPFDHLNKREQHVIEAIAAGEPVSENVNQLFAEQTTFWQRLADRLAEVVGSWAFIFSFLFFLVAWMALNTLVLSRLGPEFDPYPYILLNLVLSTLASITGPGDHDVAESAERERSHCERKRLRGST